MLRGEKTQCALGQLASLPNLHLVASIDHINAPLGACLCVYCCFINFEMCSFIWIFPVHFPVWDQFQQSQFNWLWWECVTFQHYAEETSYENSLLVQQTGALALSSLTHVLRSLTPNARYVTHCDCAQLSGVKCWINFLWLCFFAEEFSSCWWNFSLKIRIIHHTQVHTCLKLQNVFSLKYDFCFHHCNVLFLITVHRIVIPGFLPALSGGVLGELWPHTEDSADWVQRPQTDSHTQGWVLFSHENSQLSFITLQCHSLISIPMTLQGADGVEYLLVAVDANTLMDFLENEEGDWELWSISWLLNLPMERKMPVIFHAGMSNICWFWLLNSKQEKRGWRLVSLILHWLTLLKKLIFWLRQSLMDSTSTVPMTRLKTWAQLIDFALFKLIKSTYWWNLTGHKCPIVALTFPSCVLMYACFQQTSVIKIKTCSDHNMV